MSLHLLENLKFRLLLVYNNFTWHFLRGVEECTGNKFGDLKLTGRVKIAVTGPLHKFQVFTSDFIAVNLQLRVAMFSVCCVLRNSQALFDVHSYINFI